MKQLTCEQVIDRINNHLRSNRTGKQIRRDNKYQISLIAGLVESINECFKEDADDR